MENVIILILIIIIVVLGFGLYLYRGGKTKYNNKSGEIKEDLSHAVKKIKQDLED